MPRGCWGEKGLLAAVAAPSKTGPGTAQTRNWEKSAAVGSNECVQFLLLIAGQKTLELGEEIVSFRRQFGLGGVQCDRGISNICRTRRRGVQQGVERLPLLPNLGHDGLNPGAFG